MALDAVLSVETVFNLGYVSTDRPSGTTNLFHINSNSNSFWPLWGIRSAEKLEYEFLSRLGGFRGWMFG